MRKIRFKYSETSNHQIEEETKEGCWEKGEKVGALHLTQVSLKDGFVEGYVVKYQMGFYGGILRYEPRKKVFTSGGNPVVSVPALSVQGKKLFA